MIRLTRYPVCVYCGVRVPAKSANRQKGPVTCCRHHDLPRLDPFYADPPDQWASA